MAHTRGGSARDSMIRLFYVGAACVLTKRLYICRAESSQAIGI